MPVIHLTHDDLIAQDLAPYIELFQREDNMVRAVMVSHGGFPNIDIHRGLAGGRLVPASINPSIVTGLLREELGYDGLVVTDDLEMGAIARHCEIEEAALRAILAGEDMLLVCAKPDIIRRAYDSLLKAARAGELSRERIEESLRRIATFKSMTSAPTPFDPKRLQELSMEVAELNRKLNYVYGGKL
jgi:beta-N-acetylhexosaminidase